MAEDKNNGGLLAAGGLAAILASTCCLGPLILVSIGLGGAWVSNLQALHNNRGQTTISYKLRLTSTMPRLTWMRSSKPPLMQAIPRPSN